LALELRDDLRHVAGGHTQRCEFFAECGGGLALGIEANAHGHEFLLQGFVLRLRLHVGDVRAQAAGGGKRRDR
jgi:hypothetical protein